MGRSSGLSGLLLAIVREAERTARAREVAMLRTVREQQAEERRQLREAARLNRERMAEYLAERVDEVRMLNEETATRIEALRSILEDTLTVNDTIVFDHLRSHEEFPPFDPPQHIKAPAQKPVALTFLSAVKQPSRVASLLPGAKQRQEAARKQAEDAYQTALEKWARREKSRLAELEELRRKYKEARTAFDTKLQQKNAEVNALETAYRGGEADAVVAYNSMVLERSRYPQGCPQNFQVAYAPESKQLVVEYELPAPAIVPAVSEYRYVKSTDSIAEKPRKAGEIKDIYQDVVAATALRTIHEVLEADQGGHLEVVSFNGYIRTTDPATGQRIRPYLISIRTTREQFARIDLAHVDRRACLRSLGAQVSAHPTEAQAVKPIVDFNMVDKRFVERSEMLAGLESRPNLMDLNPFEFEHLVADLFQKMGLETKLTRTTKDGGVDCVAFDTRPILGGKVVIQAKRYRNTVGVSAVRDLFGTMMNEGANKGLLVATSQYGPDAYEFCKDKPIELIDGGGLLYLLNEVGIEARIVFLPE